MALFVVAGEGHGVGVYGPFFDAAGGEAVGHCEVAGLALVVLVEVLLCAGAVAAVADC